MKIIKEYCVTNEGTGKKKIVIRSNTYSQSLQFLSDLYDIAKRDFYFITKSEVEVVRYGGRRYKYTIGIEFDWDGEVAKEYTEIKHLEPRL